MDSGGGESADLPQGVPFPGLVGEGSAPEGPTEPAPEVVFDEEDTAEHVPGSFLESLPQFFVFPLILVATVTGVYFALRVLTGGGADTAVDLIHEVRWADGEHSRWQQLHNLADGLNRGQLSLDGVPAAELESLYQDLSPEGATLHSYLLMILGHKPGAGFEPLVAEALESDDADVRTAALSSLRQLGSDESVGLLSDYLERGNRPRGERFLAIGALGAIGSPGALDELAGQLEMAAGLERRNVVLALAANGDERAQPWLEPMLSRQHYGDGAELLGSAELITQEASRAAIQAELINEFLINACRAAEVLADPSLKPPLQALRQEDPSTKVRNAALNALAALDADS